MAILSAAALCSSVHMEGGAGPGNESRISTIHSLAVFLVDRAHGIEHRRDGIAFRCAFGFHLSSFRVAAAGSPGLLLRIISNNPMWPKYQKSSQSTRNQTVQPAGGLNRNLIHDLDPVRLEPGDFAGMVGQQPDRAQAEVGQDL